MKRLAILVMVVLLAGCTSNRMYRTKNAYKSRGRRYGTTTAKTVGKGITKAKKGKIYYFVCSYYGKKFHGRQTSNGETFDMHKYTCAHKSLPFNTKLRVTNEDNGKSVVVRVNDRGPFVKGRDLDLSYAAAKKIGLIGAGVKKMKVEVL